ncbi:MAG: type II secretion system protein N [Thioalkalispiraceae bacterium]|jgi:general secretion pathway protein N
MKQKIKLIILAITGFLFFLLATFPAQYAYQIIQPRIKTLSLSNIDGTLWNGSAGSVRYQATPLGALNWSLHPHDILRGHLETDFSLVSSQLQTTGTAGREVFGAAYTKNLQGHIPAQLFSKQLGLKSFVPAGKIHFSMQRMEFSPKGRLESAIGHITWEQAGISSPTQAILGNLKIDVSTEKEGVVFNISDENSPIKVKADLLVCPDGKYELNGELTPTPQAQMGLSQSLALLGKPDKNGVIKIKYEGRLPR